MSDHAISNAKGWLESIVEDTKALAEARESEKMECGQCEGTGTISGGLSGDGDDEECPSATAPAKSTARNTRK